jgi:hypothetical protein
MPFQIAWPPLSIANQTNQMASISTLQWKISLKTSNAKHYWKHKNNLSCMICNKQNQTKKKEVNWMVPIIIGSCCTQPHSLFNMNDEIQKVGKLKQCNRCGWSTHTSSLISHHITNMRKFGMQTTIFECTWGWPKMFASLNYMQWNFNFFEYKDGTK